MKRLLTILLLLTIWSTGFAAYYAYTPHGQFNWNNVRTVPDSAWLIDWTTPDTFYNSQVTHLGGGGTRVVSTIDRAGIHQLTWVYFYQSGTVIIGDDKDYDVKDTVVNLDNALGTLSDAQIDAITVGSVTGAVGSVTGAINLDNATGTLSDAQVDNITVTAGTVSDKTGYALSSTQAFSNTGTWTGNITGSVGSVTTVSDKTGYSLSSSQTFNNTGTWAGNITGNLSGSVGSVTGNVGGSVASVTGAVGSVIGNVGGNVVGSVGSVSGSVGSVTGNVGGNVTGSVGSVLALANNVITAASINDGALNVAEFANDFLHEVAVRADSGVTISLTDADIDSIVVGVLAGGVAIDTAAFRANLQASPMIVGTNNDKTDYQLATDAITSAVIAASGAHEIAQASDSGGLVLVDYNIIASTAYGYFTEGSREDAFKSGAGSGPDTVDVYILSENDSTPIVNADVSLWIGSTKLVTSSDTLGKATFGATTGTYRGISEAKPRYTTTSFITVPGSDTIFMTQPAIPDPVDTNLTGVYGYLYDLNDDPVVGAIVSVKAQKGSLQVGNKIISHYEVYDTTDAGGFWSMNLYASTVLGDTLTVTNTNNALTSTRYTFTQYRGTQQIVRKINIVVPDTSSWQFDF